MTTPATDSPQSDQKPSTAPRAAMFIVFLVVFIDLFGFGIVLPLLPRYSSSYLGVVPEKLHGAVLGLLFSIFSLMQFVFSPMWGRISDRIGRRPVLLISLCGSVVFYGLFGFASTIPANFKITDDVLGTLRNSGVPEETLSKLSLLKDREVTQDELTREMSRILDAKELENWELTTLMASNIPSATSWLALGLLFLSRMGAGIAGASVSTAAAVIADCTTPEKRARGMALIGAAFGIGFTFGPLIGYLGLTVFDQAHWAPGAMASLLSLCALLLAIRLLPETLVPGKSSPGKELFSISRTMEVLRMPTVGALVSMYFLVIFGFANFEGTLSMFTKDAFHLNERANFLVFAFIGFVLMVAQGGFYRPMAGKMSEEKLLGIGIALMLFGLAGLATVAWMAGEGKDTERLMVSFYIACAVAVFGFAFVNPSITALVSKRSDPSRQGEALGVNQSFASLGRILGPLVGLILFFAGFSHMLPYIAGVLTLILVVMLLPRIRVAAGPHPPNP